MESYDNEFLVGVRGDSIVVMRPVSNVSKRTALKYAAWIVALADNNDEFDQILKQVRQDQ